MCEYVAGCRLPIATCCEEAQWELGGGVCEGRPGWRWGSPSNRPSQESASSQPLAVTSDTAGLPGGPPWSGRADECGREPANRIEVLWNGGARTAGHAADVKPHPGPFRSDQRTRPQTPSETAEHSRRRCDSGTCFDRTSNNNKRTK